MAFSCLPTPGRPELWMKEENAKKKKNYATIGWSVPTYLDDNVVESYTIMYKILGTEVWKEKHITAPDDMSSDRVETDIKLQLNTFYIFAIKACYEDGSASEMSDISDNFMISEDAPLANLAVSPLSRAQATGTRDSNTKNPVTYQMDIKLVYSSKDGKIRKFQYGEPDESIQAREKTIMVVGATGSGKSTFINGMINYLFGVTRRCDARLRLIEEPATADQSESQTKAITAYTIHSERGFKLPNTTLTIIDTPGFGDTEGAKRDEEITVQIREFFASSDKIRGINHIDAIGFVTQSSLPRLTPTQRYIFDKILSIFGKNVEENILMLLTFADAQKSQVLSGLEKAGIRYKDYFKFNNSAIYAKKGEQHDLIEQLFWRMGEESFRQFFEKLYECEPKSLTLTKTVLTLRQKLEDNITQMQAIITIGLNQLEQLHDEMQVVERHEAEIEENKDFEFTIEEEVRVKRDVNRRDNTTNCIACQVTCHKKCDIKNDSDKHKCKTMDDDGNCTRCPNKCNYTMHRNMPYVYVVIRRKVIKTYDHLRERYNKGVQGRVSKIDIMKKLRRDIQFCQDEMLMLTDQCRQAVEHLNEIAIKPNPMSTTDYIDILISTEEGDKKPGFRKRIAELRKIRDRALECSEMLKEGHDPFVSYKETLEKFDKKDAEIRALAKRYSGLFGKPLKLLDRLKDGLTRESTKSKKKDGKQKPADQKNFPI